MQTLQTFTTCPPGTQASPAAWRRQLQEAARSSEEAGCEGMLVVTDNAQPDPWLVAQLVIEATEHLSPLVAVQDDPVVKTLRGVANARRTLRSGFTTVRNLGDSYNVTVALRDAIRSALRGGW